MSSMTHEKHAVNTHATAPSVRLLRARRMRSRTMLQTVMTAAEKLQIIFEAVNVLVAYKMEWGEPLFDI